MEKSFYKKKCLVTGGAGFIGSNLVESLALEGAHVTVLDNLSTGTKSNLDSVTNNLKVDFVLGSILDDNIVRESISGQDYVFHQAAFVSVPKSFEEPDLCKKINVDGTVKILEAARIANVKKVIFASSSSVYGEASQLPIVESLNKQPKSPYARCKLLCEKYAIMYNRSKGLRTTSLRYFNVYGPKQDSSSSYAAVVPLFFSQILTGRSPEIYGDGKQSRDFTFVDDVVQANMKAALSQESDGYAINVGCGHSTTIKDLADKIISISGAKITPVFGPPLSEGDIKHSVSDINLANKLINYNPKYGLEEGLKKTKLYLDLVSI